MKMRKIRIVADSCPLKRKNCNTCPYSYGTESSKVYCNYGDKDRQIIAWRGHNSPLFCLTMTFPNFTRHFFSSLAETVDDCLVLVLNRQTQAKNCAVLFDALDMLDTQSLGLFVRQNWMPLDGAFSFLLGALAYIIAKNR